MFRIFRLDIFYGLFLHVVRSVDAASFADPVDFIRLIPQINPSFCMLMQCILLLDTPAIIKGARMFLSQHNTYMRRTFHEPPVWKSKLMEEIDPWQMRS